MAIGTKQHTSAKIKAMSPRQKMINLMYVVLMAMLALNVSSDVLNGFSLVEKSLERTTTNSSKENMAMYNDLAEQMKSNPQKVKVWYDKAMYVKGMTDSIFNFAEELKYAIVREADGSDFDINNIINKEDLEASTQVMLAPGRGKGRTLYNSIVSYRERILKLVDDKRQWAIISSNLSTDVPKKEIMMGKNWEEYMFENMPVAAATTLLTKLQSDVRYAEKEVLHSLVKNIDLKDVRVNELSAYVIPQSQTIIQGDKFSARIIMAAVDTTQKPHIFIGNREVSLRDGIYEFNCGSTGDFTLNGHIEVAMPDGSTLKRPFEQKYTVVAPSATVSADLMNVLYAGYNNPMSVSIPGVAATDIVATMSGGTLQPVGPGKYIARPTKVGENVVITVNSKANGKMQQMGNISFRVRKLPDPTAYIPFTDNKGNEEHYLGGRGFSKTLLLNTTGIGAAIDDGLLNIAFRVISFETVFYDNMGNAIPEVSSGSKFTERQTNMFRKLGKGKRFYITRVKAIGPDGIERTLPQAMEVIVQ